MPEPTSGPISDSADGLAFFVLGILIGLIFITGLLIRQVVIAERDLHLFFRPFFFQGFVVCLAVSSLCALIVFLSLLFRELVLYGDEVTD